MVTANTSLIVLETLDQYLKYNITPSKNLPHLYEPFIKIQSQLKKDEEALKEAKIQYILDLWKRKGKENSQKIHRNFKRGKLVFKLKFL